METDQRERVSAPTILVVDDDALLRTAVDRALRSRGMRAIGAQNGTVALSLLEAGLRPGLILLDIDMPEMNGWEMIERLRSAPDLAAIPVVIISGSVAGEPKEAVRVLSKPFALSELLAVVAEHCS